MKEVLAQPSTPPLQGSRWREQSGVEENKPAAPGWVYFYFRCDVDTIWVYF